MSAMAESPRHFPEIRLAEAPGPSEPPAAPPPRPASASRFAAVLCAGWIVLGAAGFLYAVVKAIPFRAAGPLLAALLAEFPFYLVLAFPDLRERLAARRLPGYFVLSAVLP